MRKQLEYFAKELNRVTQEQNIDFMKALDVIAIEQDFDFDNLRASDPASFNYMLSFANKLRAV